MTEKIVQLLLEKHRALPFGSLLTDAAQFRITKMCQRIAGYDTKVLFFVSYMEKPICIVKTMRDASYNEKLQHEKISQEKLIQEGIDSVPRVYFDGMINGYYVYGEEVVEGKFISRRLARKKEKEIVGIIRSFPAYGDISAQEVGKIFLEYAPRGDESIAVLLEALLKSNATLKKGFTHSDFGRPNIMLSSGRIRIIDWEWAGDRPFWLIDAVYFMIKTREVKTLEEWKGKAVPAFMEYTGVDEVSALALYCVFKIFDIFHKKYPERYNAVIKSMKIL